MSDPIIAVENLGKKYLLRHQQERQRYTTLRDVLAHKFATPFRRLGKLSTPRSPLSIEEFWALKDLNFEINQGDVVGIIGRNGAGKSTLLKILSRITEPTTGRVRIRGRVASLLEVGTGFHPELTGRENIFLNGSILGMRRDEICNKFDEIVAFAEVEKFLDTPVKRYSSGMYVRLAFAVAAHLEPEILIVDEVLAVGDAQFQKRCIGRMSEVARGGRTVLFVSHNMAAVQSMCSRALWLEKGRVNLTGEVDHVVRGYLQSSVESMTERMWRDKQEAPGNDRIRLKRAAVRPENGTTSDHVTVRTPALVEIEFWNMVPDSNLNLALKLYNADGILVFTSTSLQEPHWHGRSFVPGLYRSVCHIPGDLLNDGTYRLHALFVENENTILFVANDLLSFEVHDSPDLRSSFHGPWPGAVRPNLTWRTDLLAEDSSVQAELTQHVFR